MYLYWYPYEVSNPTSKPRNPKASLSQFFLAAQQFFVWCGGFVKPRCYKFVNLALKAKKSGGQPQTDRGNAILKAGLYCALRLWMCVISILW